MSKDAETVDWECETEGGYILRISYVTTGILISLVHKTLENEHSAGIITFEKSVDGANFILRVNKTHGNQTKKPYAPRSPDRAVHR